MKELKKGDYVKFKTNNQLDSEDYQPGQPTVGFGFVMGCFGAGFVDILCQEEFADYRVHIDNCEHIKGINAFDFIGRALRNNYTAEAIGAALGA